MNLVVNGQVLVNIAGRSFWRIDDLDETRVGLDFLTNPWALVRDKDAANQLVAMMNERAMSWTREAFF